MPQFFGEVQVFFGKLVSQSIDLFVRLNMIDRRGDLHRHLRQKLEVPWIGSTRLSAANIENAYTSVSHEKRQIDHSSEAFLNVPFVFKEDVTPFQVRTDVESFLIVGPTHRASHTWNNGIAL